MAHLLYHWRYDNYQRDLDMGVGYHLNQKSVRLHQIEEGESLWAFTRAPCGHYVLAAELVCFRKTLNPSGFRYGPHRVWGDLNRSRYFSVEGQPDITRLVRSFSLRTGAEGSPLGRAFQGGAAVRTIAPHEHLQLAAFAEHLIIEPRARLLPEDLLEREMYDFVERSQDLPISDQRRHYLSTQARTRRPGLVKELRALYEGRCQLTGWDPRQEFGRDLCEAHHVQWLSRGGDDALHNLVLIAPNQHRLIHSLDAPFDYQKRGFVLRDQLLKIELNEHTIRPGTS